MPAGLPGRESSEKADPYGFRRVLWGWTKEELKNITPAQVLKHPNWSMGAKITVDSATLMNKGLEVIEASWLFGVAPESIEVVVHRESIVHSLIEYRTIP